MSDRVQDSATEASASVLAGLIATALEAFEEAGVAPDVSVLCAEHPELRGAVERALERAPQIPSLRHRALAGPRLEGHVLGGRYELGERIGSGAMGVVHRAHDRELDRTVAVKLFHGGVVDAQNGLERFHREASVLATIEHEAVVRIYDRGADVDETPYFVMEEVVGPSLADVLDNAKDARQGDEVSWITSRFGVDVGEESSFIRLAAKWTAMLAEGLATTHTLGILHRDIKPSNIRIRRDGRAVLLDFGIAARSSDMTLTAEGASLGTPAYMPPEMLRGSREVSAASDVYGLAATLYHLVCLQAPYSGTPTQILRDLALKDPAPVRKLRPGLPLDLVAIVETGTARTPAHRYSGVRELHDDLVAFLHYQPVHARRLTAVGRVWRRVRRSRRAQGAAVLAGVALVVAGAFGMQELSQRRGAQAYHDAWPHVPACLCIVNAENRTYIREESRVAATEVLNALVDSGHEPLMAHLLRGSFRFDQGDLVGARRDMDRMASASGTDLCAAIASRYHALDPDTTAIELSELPAPASAEDHYVLGFHEYRFGAESEGIDRLLGPALPANRHSMELGLLFRSRAIKVAQRGEDETAPYRLAERMLNDTLALEERSGMRSAMTAHIATFAYQSLDDHAGSMESALVGIALSDASHVTFQNGSRSARWVGELDTAIQFAEAAIARAPAHLPLYEQLALALGRTGDSGEARKVLEGAPEPDTSRELKSRIRTSAIIELMSADQAKGAGDTDAQVAAAQAALQVLEPARRLKTFATIVAWAEYLANPTAGASSFDVLLDHVLASDGLEAKWVAHLLADFPADLDGVQSAKVAQLLRAVSAPRRWRLEPTSPPE